MISITFPKSLIAASELTKRLVCKGWVSDLGYNIGCGSNIFTFRKEGRAGLRSIGIGIGNDGFNVIYARLRRDVLSMRHLAKIKR